MTARILRRLKAAQDAEEIAEFIAVDSLGAAIRFLENTELTLQRLAAAPNTGSLFESDQPELANLRYRRVIGFPNHLIFYIVRKHAIEVVRILHGARDIEAELAK